MKNLHTFFLLTCFITSFAYSQNLDSLYSAFLELNSHAQIGIEHTQYQNYPGEKCGFGLIMQIKQHFDLFTLEQQSNLQPLLQRPMRHTSFVTPGGFFRIHHDTSGTNMPSYSLTEFARAADSAYKYEVQILGYTPPPSDGNEGGDDLYDIYIRNLGPNLYGQTSTESHIGDNRFTSYIEMDNGFEQNQGYYSLGIEGAQVTIAHEFHHAIQVGGYTNKYDANNDFYYEVTSSAMEEFVFDDVNDYYFFMDSYFSNPERSFSLTAGYDFAVWNIYLKERYGFDILKRIWELIIDNEALEAIDIALAEIGSSFKYELNNFGVWTYYTNNKTDTTQSNPYFEEALSYPLISPIGNYQFIPPSEEVMVGSKPLSNNFLVFIDNSQGGSDTLISTITNGDVVSGLNTPTSTFNFTYKLTNQNEAGANKIIHNYYSKITSVNNNLLQEMNILNDTLVTNPNLQRENIEFAYPQPFSYSENLTINIPTESDPSNEADLYILSSDMDLVYSNKHRIISISKIILQWDGLDNDGKKLPSGVYIYVTKSGDNIKKGKIVIYND